MQERCNQGHFFDKTKYTLCPYCGVGDIVQVTLPLKFQNGGSEIPPTDRVINDQTGDFGKKNKDANKPGVTIRPVRKQIGMDPVVGWLVCIEGTEKGRDFRIRSEKNSIGRSEKMDICISGDDTITRDNHAFIVYNPENGRFRIQTGESRGLIYVNGEEVINYMLLKVYDIIKIGETLLCFIPFCGEKFKWGASVVPDNTVATE